MPSDRDASTGGGESSVFGAALASLKPMLAVTLAFDQLPPSRRAFRDLTGALSFDVPAGFAYDPLSSWIQQIVFVPWDGRDEALLVSPVASQCPASADDDEWYRHLEDDGASQWLADRRHVRSLGRPCLLGTMSESPASRILRMRGPRLDVVVEHRGVAGSGSELTPAMARVLESLELPSQLGPESPPTNDELLGAWEPALQALAEERFEDFGALAFEAFSLGRRSGMRSLAAGDVGGWSLAAPYLAIGAAQVGATFGSVPLMRAAEQLLLRCGQRLWDLFPDDAPPEGTRDFVRQLIQALYGAMHASYEELAATAPATALPELGPPTSAVEAALLRIRVLLAEADSLDASVPFLVPPHWAPACADLALQDALTYAAWSNRVAAGLMPDASPPPAENLLAALSELRRALELRLGYERLLGPPSPETTELAAAIARRRAKLDSTGAARPDFARALALHAEALVLLRDAPSLEDAAAAIAEADRLMEQVSGHDDCRALVESVQAQLALRRGAVDQAVDHGKRAATMAEAAGLPELVVAGSTAAARALLDAGRPHDALAALDGIAATAGGLGGVLELKARAQAAAGDLEQGMCTLANALTISIFSAGIVGRPTYSVLLSGVELLEGVDRRAALELGLAANAVATLWKASLPAATDRIAFNEGEAQLDLAARLVHDLLEEGDPEAALLAADRSRAETLNQALGLGQDREVRQGASPPPGAGDGTGPPVERLTESATLIRGAADGGLADLGVPLPPDWAKLSSALSEIGVSALVPHPASGRVIVFLVRPDGSVSCERSGVPASELAGLVATALGELQVEAAARSAPGTTREWRPDAVGVDAAEDALDRVLRRLHQALVEPVGEHLGDGEPVVVVPYRELALLPWSLLLDGDGRRLCERHPLSLVPSLATLVQLRRRLAHRRRPETAYVAGDPASAPNLALPRLPGARQEAALVAAAIRAAGTPPENVRLRVGDEPTRLSYQTDAAGADFVHLACHAALRTPAQTSPLFLAAGAEDDGMLLAPEIVETGLSDAVVFLSACQTGLGRPTADGVIGLGRAFLEAGARCVILSLWEVGDVPTAALVRHFVGGFLGPGAERLDAAGALQAAMLATRDDLRAGRLAQGRGAILSDHPRNWAAFAAIGDGSLAYRG